MAVADRNGLPLSVYIESATPLEVTLAMSTLLHPVVPDAPQNLVADNAYDWDRLDAELGFYGIELIAPHRGLVNGGTHGLDVFTSAYRTAERLILGDS
jgi:hypothetical protein